jgi:hypothetical protein
MESRSLDFGPSRPITHPTATQGNLAELQRTWDKLATIPAHKEWSKTLEPHVVSGTNRWEIYRLL